MTRPFRFGVNNTGEASLKDWQEFARKAEDLGFSTLIMQDHIGGQLAPFAALTAAAAVTSRIRLGTLVLDNDFRHPAFVAQEAATVDLLSDGRLELGLGAGWLQADYDRLGLTFDAPVVRMARFREAVALVKGYFTAEESLTFTGKHYRISDLDATPRPVQTPHPPLLIGGRQRAMLRFAAREADIVSISMLDPRGPDLPRPPTFAEKVAWVREAAGERFDRIEVHANSGGLRITDDQAGAVRAVAERLKVAPDDVLQSPANLIGSVDAIIDQLQTWRANCDLSYIVFPSRLIVEAAPIVAHLAGT